MENNHREGLKWDPEGSNKAPQPQKRKRALPKSRVTLTLWLLLALVVLAGVLGIIF